MADYAEIEVVVMVDSAGDYVVAASEENLADAWENEISNTPVGSRVITLKLRVALPKAATLSAGTIEAGQSGDVTLTVV